jgi:glycosyltransferase involved in cell wall biosynthesis
MKIVIVGPFAPFRGGIAKFNEQLALQFSQTNELLLINFKHQYPKLLFPGKEQTETSRRFSLPTERLLTPYNPVTFFSTIKKIKQFQPDLLIFPYWIPFFIPAFCAIRKGLKTTKTAVLVHNFQSHEKWFLGNWLRRRFFRSADMLISLSDFVNAQLRTAFPDKQMIAGFHPVYDDLNQNRYTPATAKKELQVTDKKVLLFFGYIKAYKGVETLISAFNFLPNNQNYHLFIVGEVYGDEKEYLELIKKYHLEKQVTFLNKFVTEPEIELFFKAADALVLPYQQASQSGVLQIATLFDLGVVVTPVGGLPELVKQFQLGVVSEATSAEALAKGIENFFSLDKKIIHEGCAEVRERYSWHALAERIKEKKAVISR